MYFIILKNKREVNRNVFFLVGYEIFVKVNDLKLILYPFHILDIESHTFGFCFRSYFYVCQFQLNKQMLVDRICKQLFQKLDSSTQSPNLFTKQFFSQSLLKSLIFSVKQKYEIISCNSLNCIFGKEIF